MNLTQIKAMSPLCQWLFKYRVPTAGGGEKVADPSDIKHHEKYGYYIVREIDEGFYRGGFSLIPKEFSGEVEAEILLRGRNRIKPGITSNPEYQDEE